jgi:photosystem II stability/assembly factor-like uncharacterized protein
MFGAVLLALLSTLPGGTDAAADDARLNDLCFVDAQHGWAVGDRGVIWHTDDAGQHWQRQPSGVECNLHGVCFLNEQFGWAAGGFSHPFTHTSSGVVLTTEDGGKTWTATPRLVLPSVRRIGFFNPRQGWAVACRSTMYPSGLFATDDGGRSWQPLPGAGGDWTAADLLNPRYGLVAGRNGTLAILRGHDLQSPAADSVELRSYTRAKLISPSQGWLVGEGGLVQHVGLSSNPPQPSPNLPKAARHFDFAALAVRGPHCWIAGAPGTRVFHTPDGGRTWEVADTGVALPLHAIAFADDQHGWAAGELGTILATSDGGRTWQVQRAGGSRAALLAMVAEPEDAPIELLARVSAAEGCLSAVELLGRRDVEVPPRDDVPLPERLHEAVVRVGGCAAAQAWRFPLRQAGLRLDSRQILDAWDRINDGRGLDALREHIVRQVRLWRPEAVLVDDARREEDDPLVSLVHKAAMQAIAQAAEPATFPEQISEAGLKPWQVKQVLAVLPPGAHGAGDLVTNQYMPELGRSLAEFVAEPRGLLRDHFTLSPTGLAFRVLSSSAGGSRDLLAGFGLPPGGEARRQTSRPSVERIELMQRIARKRRHVLAILDQSARGQGSAEQLLAQIDQLTRDLDADAAGQVLYRLGDQYYRSGRWPAAAEVFQLLVDRCPQHPLVPAAQQWLVHYFASAEAAWRVDRDVSQHQKRFERAVTIGAGLESGRFGQFIEPAIQFPLAAAYRELGRTREAERLYQSQGRDVGRGAWSTCAQAETHLLNPKGHSMKPALECVKTHERPHLDGQLDDPVWRQAKPAALQSPQHDDGDWPAEVMLAYDDEFLYVAVRCREQPGKSGGEPAVDRSRFLEGDGSESRPSKRPRDADLSGQDRIEIFLDLDRDYCTYYRLAVDRRGWTNDSLWDDGTWNPTWFVAAKRDKGDWTAEAAIPLAELTGRPTKSRDVWAVGIQRVAPNVGFQSWSTPAAVTVLPDGFGFLVFR